MTWPQPVFFPVGLHSPNMSLLCWTFLCALWSLKHCAVPDTQMFTQPISNVWDQPSFEKTGYTKLPFFQRTFCGSTGGASFWSAVPPMSAACPSLVVLVIVTSMLVGTEGQVFSLWQGWTRLKVWPCVSSSTLKAHMISEGANNQKVSLALFHSTLLRHLGKYI